MELNHIAIISSTIDSIKFYERLGFVIISQEKRRECNDEIVYMKNLSNVILEIYIDSRHPKRLSNPETLGLRHLCFQTEDISIFREEIKTDNHGRFCFIYDPDGLPIEIREIDKE